MIIGLLTDIFGTLCTGLGLRSTDPNKKYKYYRVAIYALLVARKFLFAVKMQKLVSVAIEIILLRRNLRSRFFTLHLQLIAFNVR